MIYKTEKELKKVEKEKINNKINWKAKFWLIAFVLSLALITALPYVIVTAINLFINEEINNIYVLIIVLLYYLIILCIMIFKDNIFKTIYTFFDNQISKNIEKRDFRKNFYIYFLCDKNKQVENKHAIYNQYKLIKNFNNIKESKIDSIISSLISVVLLCFSLYYFKLNSLGEELDGILNNLYQTNNLLLIIIVFLYAIIHFIFQRMRSMLKNSMTKSLTEMSCHHKVLSLYEEYIYTGFDDSFLR